MIDPGAGCQGEEEDHPLLVCEGNWKKAESNPDKVEKLVEEELKEGFIQRWKGSLEEAKEKFKGRFAKGKLGLAMSDNADPRLTLDTTVNNVNPGAIIPERVQNPCHEGVAHCGCGRASLPEGGSNRVHD